MKKTIVIGANGHAAEIRDYIEHYNRAVEIQEQVNVLGYIDDDAQPYEHYGYEEPYLGKITGHDVRTDIRYLMGIADLRFRKMIVEDFVAKGAQFMGLVHPTALVSPSAKLGVGVVISHNASVGPKAVIGNHTMLNSRCTIGHDTVLGDFNFISPRVALSGHTTIGNGNMFGTNSATIPWMKIGNNNKIGAGMIVFKEVGDDETVFFRYKERIIVKGDDIA